MWGSEPFWGLGYDWDPDWVLTDRHKELRAKLDERNIPLSAATDIGAADILTDLRLDHRLDARRRHRAQPTRQS